MSACCSQFPDCGHNQYDAIKAWNKQIEESREFKPYLFPSKEDVISATKALIEASVAVPMRVYFVDKDGLLWGQNTGNIRCPRKLKKKLKKNGAYNEFMRHDFRGYDIESLTKK